MRTPKVLTIICIFMLAASAGLAETLLWSDEFDGSAVDTSAWNFDTGGTGWGNQELQNYLVENASVSGGSLIIDIKAESTGRRQFTSARLNTFGKVQFQYGHVVARINVPDLADGLWPAWWTMGESGGWPDCGELDLMEMGFEAFIQAGTVNRSVVSAAHWDYQGSYAGYSLSYEASNDLNGSFHVWEMQWTPTMIDTYIDGHHIWAFDISDPASFSGEEFHQPHYMLINCAVGGIPTGILSNDGITAPLPAQMKVDYIRLYDNGYTTNVTIPGGGSSYCGDGTCDPGEDQCNCSDDCGTPPSTETACDDGVDEDCDGYTDCDDIDCDGDPACQSSYCGDGTCDADEDCSTCEVDCGPCGTCDNDGVCEEGEDCTNCSNDCIGLTTGPPPKQYCCGDGVCEGAEDSGNCAIDCGGGGSYCGDGTCDAGEDSDNCPEDCGTSSYCGDGTCDPGEDQCNCSDDCGAPPSTETNCTDGIDEDCDGNTDCDDVDCDGDPACPDCGERGDACVDGSDCCSGTCLPNGKCQ